MKIKDILYPGEYTLCSIDPNTEISGICYDPTMLNDGEILIVLTPDKLKGIHLPCMPAAVICSENAILPDNIPRIFVENTRLAFSYACYRYNKIKGKMPKMIAVTGTNGKTTTASVIKQILETCGMRVGFISTGRIEINGVDITPSNYSMTTPDPPLLYSVISKMQIEACDVIIMEASSHALALDKLAPLKFDYGVFTNLSSEHLDFHRDMDQYFGAKLKLFSSCKSGIFNVDDYYGRRAYDRVECNKTSVGILHSADVYATGINLHGFEGSDYIYHGRNFYFKANIPLPGAYNIYNSLLASTVCIDMGCKPCDVKNALSRLKPIKGRCEIINHEIKVIIDYAHTSEAFESILRELSRAKEGGKLSVVFGCGGNRDRGKRPRMASISEKYADNIILTSDNSRNEDPKEIIADVIKGFNLGRYSVIENRKEAIHHAILSSNKGDVVAIIGKGPENYNIDSTGYHYFNEREIIHDALNQRYGKSKCE